MSFILDALRKSENDRQRKTGPGLASVPVARRTTSSAVWPKALAALLAVNLVVVAVVLLMPDSDEPSAGTGQQTFESPQAPVADETPAPLAQPLPPAMIAVGPPVDRNLQRLDNQVVSSTPLQQVARPAPSPATREKATQPPELLPTLTELRAAGTLSLPDLHLDIHVYADQTADRFVFINMHKYREGQRLDEGPAVVEITRDGVVLSHRDHRFLLPRE